MELKLAKANEWQLIRNNKKMASPEESQWILSEIRSS